MNKSSEPLVSIVTPVYNEQEYLHECIESILRQSYHNWDYTIVDNCSTDRSLEIARRYAHMDRRIRVLRNDRFLGMLANHNVAIRQISPHSKYCKVVLGDDALYPGCLQRMVELAEGHSSVGIVSAYERCGQHIRLGGVPERHVVVSGCEACRLFLLGEVLLFGSQNSVLYRADLVRSRDPFYSEKDRYADFESCFALLKKSDLGFVYEVLTFSRPRPQSMGAISADVGSQFRSLLTLLSTYGDWCLNANDFSKCLDLHLSDYYRFLGRRVFVEHDHEFWSYHRDTFVQVGLSFSRVRLLKEAFTQLCGSLIHVSSSVNSIRRLYGLKKIRHPGLRRAIFDKGRG